MINRKQVQVDKKTKYYDIASKRIIIERFGDKLVPSSANDKKYMCWFCSTDYGNRFYLLFSTFPLVEILCFKFYHVINHVMIIYL